MALSSPLNQFFEPSVLKVAPSLALTTPTLIAVASPAESGHPNYWVLVGLGGAAIAVLMIR